MTNTLCIPEACLGKYKNITKKLNKKQQDYWVSFAIDPKNNTFQIIGGHAPEYICETIALPAGHGLKKMRFSVDGAYFSQLEHYAGEGKAIQLDIKYSGDSLPIVGIPLSDGGYFGYESQEYYLAHEEFIKEVGQQAYESARVADIQRLLVELKTYSPFQYIDIDKEKKEVRVQNDNNQTFYDIPDNIAVPTSLVLTDEAALYLKATCDQTTGESINIAVHGENITLKTNETVMTLSMAGLEEFHKNKPKPFDEVVSMVIDFNRFKKGIKHFWEKYPKIQRANQCHLLIEPTQLWLINLVGRYRFASGIPVKMNSATEPQLYLLHLKEIRTKTIPDLGSVHELKIAILKGPQGEFKLGFYKYGNLKYPYISVPVEPTPDELGDVLALKQEGEKKCDDRKSDVNKERQGDLFGLENV